MLNLLSGFNLHFKPDQYDKQAELTGCRRITTRQFLTVQPLGENPFVPTQTFGELQWEEVYTHGKS